MRFPHSRHDVARSLRADLGEPTVDDEFVERLAALAAAGATIRPLPFRRSRLAAAVFSATAVVGVGGLGVAYAAGFVAAPWAPESTPSAPSEVPSQTPDSTPTESGSEDGGDGPGDTPDNGNGTGQGKRNGQGTGAENGQGNGVGNGTGTSQGGGAANGQGKRSGQRERLQLSAQ